MPSPPRSAPGEMADHLHQVLGQPRFLQHHAHEHEQRHGDQRVVGDDAEDAVRQQVEQQRAEAELAEHEAGGGERQRRPGCRPSAARRTTTSMQDGEDLVRDGIRRSASAIVAWIACGQRLQEHQREADRDQRLEDVAIRDAAGIGGALADRPGLLDVGDREPDHDQRRTPSRAAPRRRQRAAWCAARILANSTSTRTCSPWRSA